MKNYPSSFLALALTALALLSGCGAENDAARHPATAPTHTQVAPPPPTPVAPVASVVTTTNDPLPGFLASLQQSVPTLFLQNFRYAELAPMPRCGRSCTPHRCRCH